MLLGREPTDLPDLAQNAERGVESNPGDPHQPLDLAVPFRETCETALRFLRLAEEELQPLEVGGQNLSIVRGP